MNLERMNQTITRLEQALENVRTDLAECRDIAPDLRGDEVCIEVPLSRYIKRRKNLLEIQARAQAVKS